MPLDDRERNFEDALARHVRPLSSCDACSDAETLAAYHEESLPLELMSSLKAHVSLCARCEEILEQLQATGGIPLDADIAQLETAASQAGVRVIPVRKPRLWLWVAPASALAAGLLVWVAVQPNNSGRFPKVDSTREAKAPEVAKAEPSSPAPLPPQSLAGANNEPLSANTSNPTDRLQSSAPKGAPVANSQFRSSSEERHLERAPDRSALPERVAGGVASGAMNGGAPSMGERVLDPTTPRSVTQTVTVEPPPVEVSKNRVAAGDLARAEIDAKSAKSENETRESANVRPASPTTAIAANASTLPAPAPGAPGSAGPGPQQSSQNVQVTTESSAATTLPIQGREFADLSNPHQKAQILVVSGRAAITVSAPDGRASWRIGAAGVILFSSDAGKTWLVQPSGIITDLLAGSAPSDKVCWIVGRSGTILRTSDKGKHWQKVTPPAQDDFRSVFAVNADQATVSLENATYQTTDAGGTWTKLPPQ